MNFAKVSPNVMTSGDIFSRPALPNSVDMDSVSI